MTDLTIIPRCCHSTFTLLSNPEPVPCEFGASTIRDRLRVRERAQVPISHFKWLLQMALFAVVI